jgi:hypothetical protein
MGETTTAYAGACPECGSFCWFDFDGKPHPIEKRHETFEATGALMLMAAFIREQGGEVRFPREALRWVMDNRERVELVADDLDPAFYRVEVRERP